MSALKNSECLEKEAPLTLETLINWGVKNGMIPSSRKGPLPESLRVILVNYYRNILRRLRCLPSPFARMFPSCVKYQQMSISVVESLSTNTLRITSSLRKGKCCSLRLTAISGNKDSHENERTTRIMDRTV